jgi:hypothetical protein
MKQSLPSLIAALICGLAGTLAWAGGDEWGSAGGLPMPIDAARSPLASRGAPLPLPASTAPSLLGGERTDMPAPSRPNYLPSNLTTGAGSSPIFGPQGIVPAAHAEEVPVETSPSPLPAPPTLIADSIRSLSARRSISAKTRQGAKLFGRELVGSGTFAQGPSTSRLVRYDLQLMLKDRPVSRLQISDGQYLWIVDDLKGEADIERIDVDRLVSAAAAETAAAAAAPQRDLALGGIGRLMASLEKSFEFTGIARSQLGNVPVYVIVGGWKPAILAKAMPDQFVKVSQGQGTYDTSALRGHIPNQVCVYVGADDLFPYRIEYRRISGEAAAAAAGGSSPVGGVSTATGQAGAGSSAGGTPPFEILAYIDFFEVRFDVLLDGTLFTFAPGTRPYIDVTESYLAKQRK